MDRRTYEGPMEWEYQDRRGPLDATSPFSHVAKNQATRNDFSSPSKLSSGRPNPFANSPSKPLPPLPQTSLFSPRIQHSNTAPPFRNPAFTTPRKPFDETVFSEAESSPALTEVSDLPNDTPDVDRTADLGMGGMSPTRINKNLRYGKSPAQQLKRHLPGRGEISRGNRDYSAALRKRKRHNYDRDVGSVRYTSSRDNSASDSEEEEDGYMRRQKGAKGAKRKSGAPQGWFATVVQTINQNPNMPDNLAKWMTFFVNASVVSVFLYLGWSLFSTVSTDIANAHDAARRDIVNKALECNNQFILNGCEKKDRPALKAMCDEWDECRIQDPESIMRVKNTAKQVAEVINEFAGTMSLHAWAFFFGILILCLGLNAWSHVQIGTSVKAAHPVSSNPASEVGHPQPSGFPGDSSQAYMWVPIQTPSHRRQLDFDPDGTDTDGASPPLRKTILPPPQTPSRRSPSKGDHSRSPVKYGRSPSKGY